MLNSLTEIERDALLVHLLFVLVCGIILLIPANIAIGIKLFILVIIYNLLVPLFGLIRKHTEWVKLWLFVFILSMLQIWPDWFLSAQLEVLVFPDDGLFKIGSVSGYMLFLWAIPFFMILIISQSVQERYSQREGYLTAAITSLLIFGISEMTMWTFGSWYAQNVTMIGHVAIYIIIPEIILGLTTYFAYETIKDKNHWIKLPTAFIVMILYLGNVVFFYFLIERVLLA